jgi:hypothetical protein
VIEVADSSESPTPTQLDAIGEEIATFAARINIARHAMLTRLRIFDAHGGWGRAGAVSCAHWLSWRINMKLTAAHEHVRVARSLADLPLIDAAFGRAELFKGPRAHARGYAGDRAGLLECRIARDGRSNGAAGPGLSTRER